jgi:uncharacterized protein YndB with AHSA1/START domain
MTTKEATRSFEMQLEIKAPVDAVWKALTDAHELMQWFPLNAKVKPGVGGSIWSSWGPPFEGESRIEIWEPNKRLKTGWPTWGAKSDEERARLTVDYHLEGRGGQTVLRLVHSGFGSESSWDKEYDGTSRGWSFELRGLRHYLENHRGEKRRVIWSKKATDLPVDAAMKRVIGPAGQVLRGKIDGLKEGDRYKLKFVETDRTIEGVVATNIPPRNFSGSATNLNNAFFRCELEGCGPYGREEVWVWFSTYGLPSDVCDKLEQDVRVALDQALTGS